MRSDFKMTADNGEVKRAADQVCGMKEMKEAKNQTTACRKINLVQSVTLSIHNILRVHFFHLPDNDASDNTCMTSFSRLTLTAGIHLKVSKETLWSGIL